MRNRFISDYIYKKTGKKRTAKQVGSRIQQLRDTCGAKQGKQLVMLFVNHLLTVPLVLQLLRPFPNQKASRRSSSPTSCQTKSRSSPLPLRCDTSAWSDTSSVKSPTELSPTSYDGESLARDSAAAAPLNVVYIDLIPPNSQIDISGNWDALSCHLTDQSAAVHYVQISQQPRHLRSIDPTVTLVSKAPIDANSFFTVSIQDTVVFTEVTTLVLAGPLNDGDIDGPKLYRTTLVPGYWETISNCAGKFVGLTPVSQALMLLCHPDPTQYTIEQKVYPGTGAASTPPLFSAVYKFRFAQNRKVASPSQPHQQPSKISQSIAVNGGHTMHQQSHLSSGCSASDIPPLFETFDTLISLDEDDILTEFETLKMQPAYPWNTNSPNAPSNCSLSSMSARSSPHISVSPASSCHSMTPPNGTSLMPSPTLYPVSGVHYLAPGLDTVQNILPDKAELYLESGFFPQDFFDSSFTLDTTYNAPNQ
jgi:hypothetical protein